MADKLSQLLLDALGRAALAPAGMPLFGSKAAPGLFPSTAPARQAAQRARDDRLIRLVASDPKGKSDRDLFALADAGREYLFRQSSPKQVLEDLARAIEARQAQVETLLGVVRETQSELVAVKEILAKLNLGEPGASATGGLEDAIPPVANAPGSPCWLADLQSELSDWSAAGDCPLPELYRRLNTEHATLSIGQFHDGLRQLYDREQVYLHPWTGPLYAMPEPAFALLIGHEIAYYASQRSDKPLTISDKPDSKCRREDALRPALA